MRFKIHSKKLNKNFCFWAPDDGGYVRLENAAQGKIGCLGQQICHSGRLQGHTVTCGNSQKSFEQTARKWYRNFIKVQKEMGYPG
jgi:hypothetical protein